VNVNNQQQWKAAIMNNENDIQAGATAIKLITNACNGGRCEDVARGMIQALSDEHRTLQQDFWRAVLLVSKEYATFQSDLRNQQAVELCGKINTVQSGLGRY
jgi:hypothetical protein